MILIKEQNAITKQRKKMFLTCFGKLVCIKVIINVINVVSDFLIDECIPYFLSDLVSKITNGIHS